jgi:lipoyl-dependent peroxiredoxin
METLYSAVATATGGRAGRVESSDGALKVDLAQPKELGGSGGQGTNPEQMFAGGYAACFASAAEYQARLQKLEAGAITVTATVGIGPNGSEGFGLSVALEVAVPGLNQSAAEKLVADAHRVCPYSNATRGNVDVRITTHGEGK